MFQHIGNIPKQITLSLIYLPLAGIGIKDYIGTFPPIPHQILQAHFFYFPIYLSPIGNQLIV